MISTAVRTLAAHVCPGSLRTRPGPGAAVPILAVALAAMPACGGVSVGVGAGARDPSAYEQAYGEQGGRVGMGRPTGPVSTWAFGCRQLFRGGAEGAGALMQQPCGVNRQIFGVTGDFWTFYASYGAEAAARFGFPLGRRGFLRGGWRQAFGGGGQAAYLMQRPGGTVRYLDGVLLERYLFEDGLEAELGFPVSNPLALAGGGVHQEFERGSLTVDPASGTTWIPRR